MVEITANLVKELRDRTGAGMMDCKKALVESQGNMEEAITGLRKKGIAKAEKTADRTAAEGLVGIKIDNNEAIMIEVNSETDFVARNDKFQLLCNNLLDLTLKNCGDINKTLSTLYPNSNKVTSEELKENIALIGENLTFRRASFIAVEHGAIVSYIHNTITKNLGKIGVLIALKSQADNTHLLNIGKQIAMHIAAASPKVLNIEEIDPKIIEKEKEIFLANIQGSEKPANVIEKMVDGRIRKYYEETVLLEQPFIIDNQLKIKDYLSHEAKKIGHSIEITEFIRFEVGEGIEKCTTNFAEEVAAATGQR